MSARLYNTKHCTYLISTGIALLLILSTSTPAKRPTDIISYVPPHDSLFIEAEQLAKSYSYDEALELLKHVIEKETGRDEPRMLASIFLHIGEIYSRISEYDSALFYSDSALRAAERISDTTVMCAAHITLGEAYEGISQYEDALASCERAVTMARKSHRKKLETRALSTIGDIHSAMSDHELAFAYFDSALVLAGLGEDKESEAIILNAMGVSHDAIGEYDEALLCCRSALEYNQQVRSGFGEASSYTNIATTYFNLGDYDSASFYYITALSLRRKIKDRRGEGSTLNNIGLVYYCLSEFDTAIAYLDSALLIRTDIRDKRGRGITMYNIGIVHSAISQFDYALAYYDSALTIMREIGSRAAEGSALNSIGSSHYAHGDYDKSLAYYDSALVVERRIKDRFAEAATLNNIAIVYDDLAQYDRAIAYYDSALLIKRKIGAKQPVGTTLSNLGTTYCALGQYERALAYFDSALIIERKLRDTRGESYNLDNIGMTYHALEEYDSSLSYLNSSLSISRQLNDRRVECTALNNIGRNYFVLQEYYRALAYYDTAINIMSDIGDISGEAATLDNIGQVYEKLYDIDNAVSHYERAIALKESIRKKIHRPLLKSAYIETEKDVYQRLIILLIMLERYEEAFDYLERSHSERLRKAFEQGKMSAYDPSLRRILDRINFLESEMENLCKHYRQNEISTAAFEETAGELDGRLNQKMLDLKIHHPELYNIMVPQRKTLKYIQKAMPDSTVFLEYLSVGNTYVMLVFTRNIFLVKSVVEPIDSINERILNLSAMLQSHAAVEEVNRHCQELYQMIIKPVENDISDAPNVVFIPYGMLHYLPFHVLRRQKENDDYEYFMEWKRISYLPSASFLIDLLEKKEPTEKELLAFGNADGTLPSAEIEVDLIARLFPACCVCKCDSARKDRFIDICSDYRLIHLATHGVLAPDPRFSYIVMAPPETGKLTVREILGLSGHFNKTSLVTLSACETAVEENPEAAGMELVTLSNAFKVAGVPSTVASLWEIADRSTALLMQDFYRNLVSKNVDKAEALRQAQISMLSHEQYSHPYYWAPFVLIGDWR